MADHKIITDEEGLIKMVVDMPNGELELPLGDRHEVLAVNIVKEFVSEMGYRVEVEFSGSIDQVTGTGQDFAEMDNLIRGEAIEAQQPYAEYMALWLWQRIRHMKVCKSYDGLTLKRITVRETDKCSVTIRNQKTTFGGLGGI
tara:strand:- start:93 stop:521 length:429 start_codon:yes stop_codon:yes gene_type:complete